MNVFALFGNSTLMSLVSSGVIAQLYAWPRLRMMNRGVRNYWTGGTLAAALWGMDLQSELVYNGDEGTTEPSGRTRRYGLDLEARIRLATWLWADADLNLAHGQFRDEPQKLNRIPLAPAVTSTGGLTVRDAGPVSGGARSRSAWTIGSDQGPRVLRTSKA